MNKATADDTVELMRAMGAVNVKIPAMQLGIATSSLSPEQEAAFGELLVQLGKLVGEHARQRLDDTADSDVGA